MPASRSDNHDDGHDQPVKSNSLSEDHDENHTNEDGLGLGVGSDTCVTGDSDGEAGCERGESARKAGAEELVAITLEEVALLGLDVGVDDDRKYEALNTQNTCHDDGDQAFEDLKIVDDGEGGKADSGPTTPGRQTKRPAGSDERANQARGTRDSTRTDAV